MAKSRSSPKNLPDDITRLRNEYEDRKRRFVGSNVYSWFNLANLFSIQQRQRAILRVLRKYEFTDLAKLKILEMGCGGGGVLLEFLNLGAPPSNLYGVDLLSDRLVHAHQRLSGSNLINADGQLLPFPSHSFDLVMQFTALSSLLDPDIRVAVCKDMLRVLQNSGLLLWYDFWINPANPQTHGMRSPEIRSLFPNCSCEFHKITLAPPLARRIVPISWMAASFLEKLGIFNSHYLVAIRPVP